MMRFDAVVVGLGNVGLSYDLGTREGEWVTSHARAFAIHPGYKLVAGVEPDEDKRALFERHYGVPAYSSIAKMLYAGVRPEVWSIAVPTPIHFRTFEEIIALRPTAVLCEKPLAEGIDDALRMVEAASACDCALAVNYMRRSEPGVLTLRSLISEGALGEIYKGCAWYSKGLLNNGSHIIDLLAFLVGPVGFVQVLNAGRSWVGGDPEPDVCLSFGGADVVLLSTREECFSYIGFELVGTLGTVRYIDRGHRIELRKARSESSLTGHSMLATEVEMLPTDLKRYQWYSVDVLYRHLEEGTPLLSSGGSALKTLRTIDRLRTALAGLNGSDRHHD